MTIEQRPLEHLVSEHPVVLEEHLPELPVFKLPVFRPTDSTVQLFS